MQVAALLNKKSPGLDPDGYQTAQILETKIGKLEQLVRLKDAKASEGPLHCGGMACMHCDMHSVHGFAEDLEL